MGTQMGGIGWKVLNPTSGQSDLHTIINTIITIHNARSSSFR